MINPKDVHASWVPADLTSAEEYPDEEYLDTSKSSSLRKEDGERKRGGRGEREKERRQREKTVRGNKKEKRGRESQREGERKREGEEAE